MRLLIFSTNMACDNSHSKKNSARYYHKCTSVFMQSTCYSCQILTKFEFSRHIRKIFKYQISWKSIHWEPSCSTRTDGEREKAFGSFTNAPKNRWKKGKRRHHTPSLIITPLHNFQFILCRAILLCTTVILRLSEFTLLIFHSKRISTSKLHPSEGS